MTHRELQSHQPFHSLSPQRRCSSRFSGYKGMAGGGPFAVVRTGEGCCRGRYISLILLPSHRKETLSMGYGVLGSTSFLGKKTLSMGHSEKKRDTLYLTDVVVTGENGTIDG